MTYQHENLVKDYAFAYHQLNFVVIPTIPQKKQPAVEWGSFQLNRASWNEIERLFDEAIEKYGDCGIGVICGKVSGLVVLDVDDENKWHEFCRKHNLNPEPSSIVVKTPHGWHFYFRYPRDKQINRLAIRDDKEIIAELRGDNHFVVCPPTKMSDSEYIFVKDDPFTTPLPDIPDELFRAFVQSNSNHRRTLSDEVKQQIVDILTKYWDEGTRHDLTLGFAGFCARRGVSEGDVMDIVTRCVTKAGDRELKDRLRAVEDTYLRHAEGNDIVGLSLLEQIMTNDDLKSLIEIMKPPTNGSVTVIKFPPTDLGNAERLVEQYREQIAFVPSWGWLVWNGRRWVTDKSEAILTELAGKVVRSIYDEISSLGSKEERERLAKWAIASESEKRIASMLKLARAYCIANPDEFDANPNLLNCLNGVVNLETGELMSHNPSFKLTKLCPVEYHPDAEAPLWEKFLDDIFLGDRDLVSYIQRVLGYALTGEVVEEGFFICWGTGSNGKSTFFGVLLEILGDYAKTISSDAILRKSQQSDSHPTAIADLFGVRLAVVHETDEGKYLSAARVKMLTGRDIVKARFMHRDYFQFRPTHKIFLVTNYKPIIRDTTPAMWRRIHLIPFRAFFDEQTRDVRMMQKLLAEKEGILAWLVRGCLEWREKGLNPPAIVREATKQYRTEQDVIQSWLEENCVADPNAFTSFKELYDDYVNWCKENDEEPAGQRSFANRLSEKGFETKMVKIEGKVMKVRQGIRLKKQTQHEVAETDEFFMHIQTDFANDDEDEEEVEERGLGFLF
ncbi:MAG: phage/plasmid primase, P4 family [Nitrososphaerota archaeon]